MKQRAKQILDILIQARDIHPLFAVSVKTIAKRLYDPEYSSLKYYTEIEAYHRKIWRAIPLVIEMGKERGLTVFWVRKHTAKDPNRFGRILGYRILLPGEDDAAMLTEAIYRIQKVLDLHYSLRNYKAAVNALGYGEIIGSEDETEINALEKIHQDWLMRYKQLTYNVQFL